MFQILNLCQHYTKISLGYGSLDFIYTFDVHVTVHHDKFLIINQPDVPIFQIYFGKKLHILDSSSVLYQEFSQLTSKPV